MASPYGFLGPGGLAAGDLGLKVQLDDETEDERKKREQEDQQRRALGPLAGQFSLASRMLGLGSYGGPPGGIRGRLSSAGY